MLPSLLVPISSTAASQLLASFVVSFKMLPIPKHTARFPLEPMKTKIGSYTDKLGPRFKPDASLYRPDPATTLKDVTSRLDVKELAEVQPIDRT